MTVDKIKNEILKVLEPEFYEELTHQQMKLIADQSARRIFKEIELELEQDAISNSIAERSK